jgi:ABC-type transport system substrate-binding protein
VRTVASLAGTLAAITVSVAAASGTGAHDLKEGGTFRVATLSGRVDTIDPALLNFFPEFYLLAPACGTLMAYPDKPLPPAGSRLAPSLAESEPDVSRDGRTYTFTVRKDARFSNGAPVTARAFVHALERIFKPAMKADAADAYLDIVGAQKMFAGQATTLAGAVAKGRTLTVRLTRRPTTHDFLDRLTGLCAVPTNLPADPEGATAPLPSAAPYYVSEYVPGQRLVLERNRFYRGERPHHVARFVADLAADFDPAIDQVESGTLDALASPLGGDRMAKLAQRYGVNKSQFFVKPEGGLRLFDLNTSRPLFRNNVKLRQAVNFAVDRKALVRESGPYAATATDQFLTPRTPGYRNAPIYPLEGPDLRKARALAAGHTRSGKAVLYTTDLPGDVAQAQILQRNLSQIGLELEIQQFPVPLFFQRLGPGEPFDVVRIGQFFTPDTVLTCFDGRTIGQPSSCNVSYFDSPKYDRLLDRASRLRGEPRYRAYGDLDVQLSRDAAPAIPVAFQNALSFVSARVGCVVVNPFLDLTAVCLK